MNGRGQSTVELALCLPVLALLMAAVVEIGALAGDKARVWHAAREAVRLAAVDADPSAIEAAAERTGLDDLEVVVDPEPQFRRQGDPVTVDVTYDPPAHVPILGLLFAGTQLHAQASMRIEEP
jgi:hypothetical protein